MKKILTLLFVSLAIITVKAQKNSDIAIQVGTTVSADKLRSLITEPVTTPDKDHSLNDGIKKGLTIMPNVATQNIKIIFKTDKRAEATIEVVDETGKKVLHQSAQLIEGKNSIDIDNFHSLNEGTYIINLISNNETYTSKFLFWK